MKEMFIFAGSVIGMIVTVKAFEKHFNTALSVLR
jgi:hypothetical protein